jgi:hypothetical protein
MALPPTSGKRYTAATETAAGVLETATNAEAVAKAATDKALVPGNIPDVMASPSETGRATPAYGRFSPAVSKGPAIINSGFVGTVTATASTTVTFSSAADAVLAGYHATAPVLGVTLISDGSTRYIQSWTNSTTCVVDTAVTWAGTAITSVQGPISFEVTSAGVLKQATFADGTKYTILPNAVDTTLSGTPKIFTIMDSAGTPYYFKAYPTKA